MAVERTFSMIKPDATRRNLTGAITKVFEENGRYLTTLESPGVSFDMVITDDSDLLVMDRNSNEVRQYQLNQ